MNGLGDIKALFSHWIDSVAGAIVAAFSSFGTRTSVQIIEGQIVASRPDSITAMLDGSRAELVLRPARVLFRPLELPQRATEFLGGVVRAQIDRLTPWSANDAAFGWSEPAAAGPDRIAVTVAATARTLVQPLVDALFAAGAEAVTVTAKPPEGATITVLDHRASGSLDFSRVRSALVAVLIGAGLLAGISLSAAAVVGVGYANQQDELSRRIAERRAAIRLGREG